MADKNIFEKMRDECIVEKRYFEYLRYIIDQNDTGYYDEEFYMPFEESLLENNQFVLLKFFWKHIISVRISRFWRIYNFYIKSELNNPENGEPKNIEYFRIVDKNLLKENESKYPAHQDRNLTIVSYWHDALWHLDKYTQAMQKINATDEIERANLLKESVYNLKKPKAKKTTDKRKMNEDLFWELIKEVRQEAQSDDEFIDMLKNKLEAMSATEIKKFQKILLEKTNELEHWDTWALAYIVRGGCGDDAFDYFKAWVVSQGQDAFEYVKNMQIENLKKLFKNSDPQFEEFMYVAQEAYENKKNEMMPNIRVKSQEIQGEQWAEDSICKSYPKLCKIFDYKD